MNVDILRKGSLKFWEEFLKIVNTDSFQYMTIASVCMAIYRSKYIWQNTIVINEPIEGIFKTISLGLSNIYKQMICGEKVDGW